MGRDDEDEVDGEEDVAFPIPLPVDADKGGGGGGGRVGGADRLLVWVVELVWLLVVVELVLNEDEEAAVSELIVIRINSFWFVWTKKTM